MRILFCSFQEITESLGFSRVLIPLREELQRKGHFARIIGPKEIGCQMEGLGALDRIDHYAERLRKHLLDVAHDFDVIEFDHEHLPYPRSDFDPRPLFVARSVLLVQHLEDISIPEGRRLRNLMGKLIKGKRRKAEAQGRIECADLTCKMADLVNVPNHWDMKALVQRGVSPEKISMIPYGLSRQRQALFSTTSERCPERPLLAFVGTFDYRKGATHLPLILEEISRQIPDVRLRMIGCKGLFRDPKKILSFFPPSLRPRVEIVMSFQREEIAQLLSDCSLGLFPSYMEGFPFGILEMMAAHLPVLAFDAPGASALLDQNFLVPIGDSHRISEMAVTLLSDPFSLQQERKSAYQHSLGFTWERVADLTIAAYEAALQRKRFEPKSLDRTPPP